MPFDFSTLLGTAESTLWQIAEVLGLLLSTFAGIEIAGLIWKFFRSALGYDSVHDLDGNEIDGAVWGDNGIEYDGLVFEDEGDLSDYLHDYNMSEEYSDERNL